MTDLEPIPSLLFRLQTEGISVKEVEDWHVLEASAFLLRTESRAAYIFEPRNNQPGLVSRVAEVGPKVDYDGPPLNVVLERREGNPDGLLSVGKRVAMLGISRKSSTFDPDSIYDTSPLVEIKYLNK